MKKMIMAAGLLLIALTAEAQVKTPQASPKSEITQVVGLTNVHLDYSRPSTKGRIIFGDLVPFGKTWRTGANANTVITFSEDVKIGGKDLAKGSYALYTVPRVDSWDIIFYKDTNNWGLPEQWNESKIALKTSAKPENLNRSVETFSIEINNITNDSGNLEISWEKTVVSVKFDVPTQKTATASIEATLSGPSADDYFAAAQYYYQSNKDLNKALTWVNAAIEKSKTEAPFWILRQKSLIQAKLGDKKGAVETAKLSLAGAEKAKNADYAKMNKDSIAEWSKK
ncbi:MAG TPA: DUF2911 domain-containing protein [Flavobacterium sp.]|nr:DUF2911 domain-containing protein [Flavobacterium sp.]